MAHWRPVGIALLVLLAQLIYGVSRAAPDPTAPASGVLVMEIEGTIGPITAEYFRNGLRKAQDGGAGLVLLRMDTPGGLDAAMRDIVKDILAARVPVACYVSPSGARAASAGTYIPVSYTHLRAHETF